MSFRLTVRALTTTAALLSLAACGSDGALATAPAAAPALARGSSSNTPSVAVAGTWAATVPSATNPSDSTRWSLFLTQKDNQLEGSLTRISYINGASYLGVSAIKRGSISGRDVSLEFDRGEGAETAPTFFATVSDDGISMTGFHSRYPGSVTLVRR
jgi:predicted small lipoprotein YifL